jgi:hypothetical protein
MLEVTFQKRLPGFALDIAFTTDKELAALSSLRSHDAREVCCTHDA